jgi:NDP-sugar pyrophosphorylase family protein
MRNCAWFSYGFQLGPNVSISANARIGPGVRLIGCIILDGVEVKENAVVIHSIVGWKSLIGRWARVQGAGDYNTKLGITILGMWFVSLELFGWIGCRAFSHDFTSHLEASTTILVTILSVLSFPLLLSPFLDQDRLRDLPTLQTIFDNLLYWQ